jgi:UDP-glucose 4-epimerase
MHTWVIGSGGLLGGALLQEFPEAFRGGPINWADASQSGRDLSENLSAFRALVSANPQPWLIVWAAGQATVSSDKETCLRELRVFTEFIGMLNEQLPEGPGTFFLTSSAGGVYAGSKQAPFSASSPVAPLSEYGSLKLQQETAATKLKGVRVMIGRVSNLYGPGQDLNKLQGLVSRLVKAGLDKETINIFVPLDTIRDFIFVQDAAATIAQVSQDSGSPNLLVIASGEPKSLGTVIAQVQDVLRIKIPIAYGVHDSGSGQASDLRMTPTVLSPRSTPFPVGVKSVISDLLDRLQNQ